MLDPIRIQIRGFNFVWVQLRVFSSVGSILCDSILRGFNPVGFNSVDSIPFWSNAMVSFTLFLWLLIVCSQMMAALFIITIHKMIKLDIICMKKNLRIIPGTLDLSCIQNYQRFLSGINIDFLSCWLYIFFLYKQNLYCYSIGYLGYIWSELIFSPKI